MKKKNPSWTKILLLINILLIPLYVIRLDIFSIPTNISELAMLFSILCYALFSFQPKHFAKKIADSKLLFFFTATLLIGVISSLVGLRFSLAGLGILKSWFIIPIIFSFALLDSLDNKNDFDVVILFIFTSTLLVSLSAIFYKLAGLVTFDGRLQAFYDSPNYLAMYISPGILCGLYLMHKSHLSSKKIFYLLSLFVVLEAVVLFFTKSYSNWIGLFFALLIISLTYTSIKQRYYTAGLLMFLLVFVFATQLGSPKLSLLLENNPRSSFSSRIMIWRASFLMIEKNPILGIGAGNFQKEYLSLQPYFPPYLEWAVPHPHNLFLAFWLEAGLVGLVSFVAVLYITLRLLFKKIETKKDTAKAALLVAFFIYIIIVGLFDTPYWKNDLAAIFWIFIILAISIKPMDENAA